MHRGYSDINADLRPDPESVFGKRAPLELLETSSLHHGAQMVPTQTGNLKEPQK